MRAVFAVAAFLIAACSPPPAAPSAPETVQVEVAPGVTLHVEIYGDGPNVVIIPGRLFLADDFRALATPDRTLVMYDMRNRGASSRVEDGATINIIEDVRDLEAVRAHVGAERVSLIGYSYLGLMVALYAAERPERVDRLVQIGPAQRDFGAPVPPEWTAGADSLSPEGAAAQEAAAAALAAATSESDMLELCNSQRAAMQYWLVGNPANATRVPDTCIYENERPDALRRHFGFHFADIQQRDFPSATFETLAQPTLVIHGTLDRNAPYGSGRDWATLLRDARLITVQGGAHNVWLDDAGVVTDIDAFLRGEWPERAEELVALPPPP
jgi:proline iminopeptidase